MKLSQEFYLQENVVELAKDLLGKVIYAHIRGVKCAGMIVETEAYEGITDRASHAWNGRLTPRTQTMYQAGGISYVYFCYGIHHLFNVVTGPAGTPHAVLVRAIEPLEGVNHMLERRGLKRVEYRLGNGPGSLCRALGITREHNELNLRGKTLWISDEKILIPKENIIASPRVGVDYAGADAQLPYRFRIKNNPWIGK